MTRPTTEPVSIRLLDREYTVGCTPDERDSLIAAARLLDAKMREIRGPNRMAGLDRVAVLAALNFAHELQQLRDEAQSRDRALSRSLADLNQRLDGLLDPAPR
jgi:cell division protein ZapA